MLAVMRRPAIPRRGARLSSLWHGRTAVSSTRIAAVVVVVVLVAGLAYYAVNSGASQTSHTTTPVSTSAQAPNINLTQAYLTHLAAFGNRTVCTFSATCVYSYAVLNDYNDQSAVTWRGGNSSYLESGTFSGMTNIQSLYQRVTGATNTMIFKITSIKTTGDQLRVIMGINGVGRTLGKYSGIINASVTYSSSGGAWSISKEVWTYTTLIAQNTAGYQPYVSNYASG